MANNSNKGLSSMIRQQRLSRSLTLRELAAKSGISTSHLYRIERGERLPSAHILRRVAKPLGFEEDELFMLAGFLSRRFPVVDKNELPENSRQLDPYVSAVLSQEPVEVQRSVIGILSILKILAKSVVRENLRQ